MSGMDNSSFDFSEIANFSTSFANQIADEQNRMIDDMRAFGEYNARKDKALFQTAEASIKQKELLEQQLDEVREQNRQLKENYDLLKELYESTKKEADSNAKEAKANKIFGWVSFAVGTMIGIAGIVFGILF